MNSLLIKQVKYIGTDYIYESPILTTGLNILEGENGSGKTTFSSLIYFGFGGNVKWFKEDKKNDHQQIINDKSNYAEISIQINDINYSLTRYFYSTEIHIIGDSKVISLPINRSKKKKTTFSDWLLEKLNIKVVDIYQGSEYYKINFYDLIRLVYYDQNNSPDKIYKRPDVENYISNSSIIRKAIFEILTGNSFTEYYESIANYRKALDKRAILKAVMQNFESLNVTEKMPFEGKNSFNLNKDLIELLKQLKRLSDYRESIKGNVTSTKSDTDTISDKTRQYTKLEGILLKERSNKNSLLTEFRSVKRLKEDLVLEVTHMQKIIITNETLDLFSPETCPYCLQKASKEKNKCICGNKVSDEEYQKFFYTKEEYLNILKSKQKNIETIDNALENYEKEINETQDNIAKINYHLQEYKTEISRLTRGRKILKNDELKTVNDRILELEKYVSALRQQIKVEEKREELEKERALIDNEIAAKRLKMESLKIECSKDMNNVISTFNTKYYSLMKKALSDCTSARISTDNYMPIINSGSYKEASSNVSKRLMYFYTLLHLSLTQNIKFPRFLMIDTPENIGIDDKALKNIIALISELGDETNSIEHKAQIILTTGIKKYPDFFESKVFSRISKKDRLLKKRPFDIGS